MTKQNIIDQKIEVKFYELVEKFDCSKELEKIKFSYEEKKEEAAAEGDYPSVDELEDALNLYKELETSILVVYEKNTIVKDYDIDKYDSLDEEISFTHDSDNNNATKCEDYDVYNLIEALENTETTGNPSDIRTAVRSAEIGKKGYIIDNIYSSCDSTSERLELVECNSTLERDIEYNNLVLNNTDQHRYFIKQFKNLDDKDIDILFNKYI